MIADIRKFLGAAPFEPFTIVTSAGKHYPVPTIDHVAFNPKGTRVLIFFDEGGQVAIAPLHIVALEQGMSASGS